MFTVSRIIAIVLFTASLFAQAPSEVESVMPQTKTLYVDLHEHPELSTLEKHTAETMAAKLRALGYDVTEHVGGTGVVALMKNGTGPVIMLRTELDGLPVEEKTGLPYASKAHQVNTAGTDVPVMHACGHDVHMASLVGTAEIMAKTKNTWHGTLMLIGQPAEETITGAKAMLDDGLFTKFPKPTIGVALHTTNSSPAGKIELVPEFSYANADSVRVTIYGRGGHGSAPQTTIDPVVIAAAIVTRLQAIVAREIEPGQPGVITVGYIHAGLKNNIIADTAEMGITVRSYSADVRKHLLAGIDRVVKGEAEAAGVERAPEVVRYETTDAVYNDPKLNDRVKPALEKALGPSNVLQGKAMMGSEDYSYFINQGVPSVYYRLGVADPQKFAEAKSTGKQLPSNHSPLFAPDADPSLRTAIASEVAVLRELLK